MRRRTAMGVVLVLASMAAASAASATAAESETARRQLQNLATRLDLYRLYVGRYPTEDEGLMALIERQVAGGLVEDVSTAGADMVVDPWGKPYLYRYPGRHGEYDLYSLGADQAEGGDGENADITNW